MKTQLLHNRFEILDLAFNLLDRIKPERMDDNKTVSVCLTIEDHEVYYSVKFSPIYDDTMNFVVWSPKQHIEMSIKEIIN